MNEIENAYREMYRGMVEKNNALLSEVLAEHFTLIHMTGMRQSKEGFIRAVEDGTLNYYSADHRHFEVKEQDNTAFLTGQSVVNAAVFGGGRHTWRLQLDCKLMKDGESWKITEARASTW